MSHRHRCFNQIYKHIQRQYHPMHHTFKFEHHWIYISGIKSREFSCMKSYNDIGALSIGGSETYNLWFIHIYSVWWSTLLICCTSLTWIILWNESRVWVESHGAVDEEDITKVERVANSWLNQKSLLNVWNLTSGPTFFCSGLQPPTSHNTKPFWCNLFCVLTNNENSFLRKLCKQWQIHPWHICNVTIREWQPPLRITWYLDLQTSEWV